MLDLIIWIALTMSIAPAVLAVWVFAHLNAGHIIVGDSYNLVELITASLILCLLIIAWCGFTARELRR